MAIDYSILRNNLTNDPKLYSGKVKNVKRIHQDELIEMMDIHGQVTKTESIAVLTSYKSIIKKLLAEGYTVITAMNKYSISITGSFDHKEDTFNAERNKIKLNSSPSKEMQDAVKNIRVKRVDAQKPTPRIDKVINTSDNTLNTDIIIGLVVEIKGRLLKFDEGDDKQGVFLIQADGTEHRCTKYIINMPATLMFYVPNTVPEGVVSIVFKSFLLDKSELRSFTFPNKLNVKSA